MQPAIVVTGASSGIGRELARVAAREGFPMVLVARSSQALASLAAELAGIRVHIVSLDLTDVNAGHIIERELERCGLYCDVLVNSAGVGLFGPIAGADRAEQMRLVDLNVRALIDLTMRFVPGMVARRRGGVLNLGSAYGYMPGPYMAMYLASKAFIRSFSYALAAELKGTGVTVTCLMPGVVQTAFFDSSPLRTMRVFKLLPRGNAADTAEAGWRGFRNGKRAVIPRLVDRIMVAVLHVLPSRLLPHLRHGADVDVDNQNT
jgi:hypothetical protein